MSKTNKQKTEQVLVMMEKTEPWYIVGVNEYWYSH